MDKAVEWGPKRFPFEALSGIYPGEYGADDERSRSVGCSSWSVRTHRTSNG
jgi:hypothetical protein